MDGDLKTFMLGSVFGYLLDISRQCGLKHTRLCCKATWSAASGIKKFPNCKNNYLWKKELMDKRQ